MKKDNVLIFVIGIVLVVLLLNFSSISSPTFNQADSNNLVFLDYAIDDIGTEGMVEPNDLIEQNLENELKDIIEEEEYFKFKKINIGNFFKDFFSRISSFWIVTESHSVKIYAEETNTYCEDSDDGYDFDAGILNDIGSDEASDSYEVCNGLILFPLNSLTADLNSASQIQSVKLYYKTKNIYSDENDGASTDFGLVSNLESYDWTPNDENEEKKMYELLETMSNTEIELFTYRFYENEEEQWFNNEIGTTLVKNEIIENKDGSPSNYLSIGIEGESDSNDDERVDFYNKADTEKPYIIIKYTTSETFGNPIKINDFPTQIISDSLDVQFDFFWNGGVSPYTIEIELGDGETIYEENIVKTSYSLIHTYSTAGPFEGTICVYDNDNTLENDCEDMIIVISCIENTVQIMDGNYFICRNEEWRLVLDLIELTDEEQQAFLDQINLLSLTIEEKAEIISNLNLTLESQIELIKELELTIEEKAIIINQLQLNIEQQTILITQMELTVSEQAEILTNLNLTINQQAVLIESLTTNLQEKADLISQLEITNQEQADLISQMELSFAEQAEIINQLENLIGDDAEIVLALYDTVEEQALLINELELSKSELADLISQMGLTNQENAELILALKLTTEEQLAIISNLKLSIEDERELISQLRDTIEDQNALIDELNKLKQEVEEFDLKTFWEEYMLWIILVGLVLLVFVVGGKRK